VWDDKAEKKTDVSPLRRACVPAGAEVRKGGRNKDEVRSLGREARAMCVPPSTAMRERTEGPRWNRRGGAGEADTLSS
jgi:hypothetical protein